MNGLRETNRAEKPNRHQESRLMFKIPNTKEGNRLIREIRGVLNTHTYNMRVRGTHRKPTASPERGFTPFDKAQMLNVYINLNH